jgi:hypothetical protein
MRHFPKLGGYGDASKNANAKHPLIQPADGETLRRKARHGLRLKTIAELGETHAGVATGALRGRERGEAVAAEKCGDDCMKQRRVGQLLDGIGRGGVLQGVSQLLRASGQECAPDARRFASNDEQPTP